MRRSIAVGRAHGSRNGFVLARGLAVVAALAVGAWWFLRESADPVDTVTTPSAPAVAPSPERSIETGSALVSEPTAGRSELPPAPKVASKSCTIVAKVGTSLASIAKPFPNLAVEAGAGFPLDPSEAALARGVTDEAGMVSLELEWSAIDAARARPGASIWARVVADGYQQLTRTRYLPAEPGKIDMRLTTYPGSTVRGRVFSGALPTAGKVYARPITKDGSLGIGPMAEAKEDGWFELSIRAPGTFHVVADAGARGKAALLDVVLPTPEPLELHVAGSGVLRGHVRDSKGRPASGVEILVILAELDDGRGIPGVPEPRASQIELEGRGQWSAELRTDAEGAFDARGLREGAWLVRARTNQARGFPRLLTPTPVASDGRELALVLDHAHILVHVVKPDGTPCEDAAVGTNEGGRLRWRDGPQDRWPELTTAVVVPVRETAHLLDSHSLSSSGAHLEGRRVGPGNFVFDVERENAYRVGLFGGSNSWKPQEVDVPSDSGLIEVTLTAAEPAAAGKLAVTVLSADGKVLRNAIEIRIEDADEGAPLVVDDMMIDASSPKYFKMPAGRYRVVVMGRPSTDSHHGVLMSPVQFGHAEYVVDVAPDRTTEVTAVLPAGGRLRVRVPGEVTEADRTTLLERNPGMNFGGPIDNWAGHVELWLHQDGHWPRRVWFTFEMRGSSAAGTHLGAWIPIGTEDTSQLLPAGRFRLEARMIGGRTASTEVVLVDGETTSVTLAFP